MADVQITLIPDESEQMVALAEALENVGLTADITYDDGGEYVSSVEVATDAGIITFYVEDSQLLEWQRADYWARDAELVAERSWRD